MKLPPLFVAPALVAILCVSAQAQVPHPPLGPCPAPLLHILFSGPPGLRVTFFQGNVNGREYPAPVKVGLRPGYIHRVKLTGFPRRPGEPEALYPTLEVLGTLQLPPHFRAADFPVPIRLSDEDIQRVAAGAMLTKVIVLEHPDRALAGTSRPDEPLELEVPPGGDPVAMARELGRPLLIVRIGEREATADELAHQSIPNTILLPGENGLGPAPVRPWVPWACWPLFDPILGPRPPEEECLHDGGDAGQPVGLDLAGRLHGLEPADTVAEYTDSKGGRHLTDSNRVCICSPRFVVLRAETNLGRYEKVVEIGTTNELRGQEQVTIQYPQRVTQQYEQLQALRGQLRPKGSEGLQALVQLVRLEVLNAQHIEIGAGEVVGTAALQRLTLEQRTRFIRQIELAHLLGTVTGPRGVEQSQAPTVVGRVERLDILVKVEETRDVTVCCNEAPLPPDKPLVLFKWADRQSAQVGDVVTLFLKYSNVGCQPITDVAVSDSLTGRLDYIPGSAQSDRDAVFTTQPNEAGSVILRWEIRGRLLPGQSGVVRFQARVR
jgi:uncharacterized repeat protein (TIGR01451 family)